MSGVARPLTRARPCRSFADDAPTPKQCSAAKATQVKSKGAYRLGQVFGGEGTAGGPDLANPDWRMEQRSER
jgi:hypothetical protein